MNNPQGVSPNKGKQGTTRGKEKNVFKTDSVSDGCSKAYLQSRGSIMHCQEVFA